MTLHATRQFTKCNPINIAHQSQCDIQSIIYVVLYIAHVSKTSWHTQVIKML